MSADPQLQNIYTTQVSNNSKPINSGMYSSTFRVPPFERDPKTALLENTVFNLLNKKLNELNNSSDHKEVLPAIPRDTVRMVSFEEALRELSAISAYELCNPEIQSKSVEVSQASAQ